MKKRGKKLIDKKYQLKTAATIITASILSFLLIIGILISIAVSDDEEILTNTASRLDSSVVKQEQLVQSVIAYSQLVKNNDFEFAANNALKDHRNSIGVIKENIDLLKGASERTRKLLFAIIFLMVLQAIILYWLLLHQTHRVSGPIYVMSQYLEAFRNGQKVEFRELRKKDEFKQFYNDFSSFINHLQEQKEKEKEKKKQERAAARAAKKSGTENKTPKKKAAQKKSASKKTSSKTGSKGKKK